jgi:hypothetical protein
VERNRSDQEIGKGLQKVVELDSEESPCGLIGVHFPQPEHEGYTTLSLTILSAPQLYKCHSFYFPATVEH